MSVAGAFLVLGMFWVPHFLVVGRPPDATLTGFNILRLTWQAVLNAGCHAFRQLLPLSVFTALFSRFLPQQMTASRAAFHNLAGSRYLVALCD